MDPEEAQRLIDKEILVLKTQWNTYARISRLPNKILVEIFATLQGHDNIINVQAWHHVAHVCQHWRCVSLESASLWTTPPTNLHDYTLLMLEHSCTSPLEIQMFPATSKATCTAILSHIGQIKSLNIKQLHLALEYFQRTLLALEQEALLLKILDITQESSRDSFCLSTSTFHHFPSLKVLCLIGIDFDWMIFPICSLTTLSLACL
jgi:hypothetical protein